MLVVCVLDRVLCSSRCLCFVCDPMVFQCVPDICLVCLTPVYWDLVACFCLVKFLCAILLRMGCGRSLTVLRILPTGMCFLPTW